MQCYRSSSVHQLSFNADTAPGDRLCGLRRNEFALEVFEAIVRGLQEQQGQTHRLAYIGCSGVSSILAAGHNSFYLLFLPHRVDL